MKRGAAQSGVALDLIIVIMILENTPSHLFVSNKAGQIEPAAELIRSLIAPDSCFARHPVSNIRFGSEGSKAKKRPIKSPPLLSKLSSPCIPVPALWANRTHFDIDFATCFSLEKDSRLCSHN
jgi:hypothetical protein